MDNDLISRSALIACIGDVGHDQEDDTTFLTMGQACAIAHKSIVDIVKAAPAVDAVVLPEGKPGDYLEWDNGVGHRQIYAILSVMICKDCIRYELADFAPVVNHKGIVRILSQEEVEKMVKERGKAWKYMWCEDDNKTASGTEG